MPTFHQFSSLPLEIRRIIWHHCLPRRVAEVDIPRLDGSDLWEPDRGQCGQKCWSPETSRRNAVPPAISRVCRESREVASEVGHWSHYDAFEGMGRIWVQPARDAVLHLNWDRTWAIANGNYATAESAVPYFFTMAARERMVPSVRADLFFPFSITEDFSRMSEEEQTEAAIQIDDGNVDGALLVHHAPKTVFVAIALVVLHSTEEEAMDSGLFGLCGDERIQAVHIDDVPRLRAFSAFWRATAGDTDKAPGTYFSYMLDNDNFHKEVECWIERARIQLFGQLWLEARTAVFAGIEDPANIWVPPLAAGTQPFNPTNRPNPNHPWARKQLDLLPELVPQVLFRHCSGKSHDE
ncbi:Pol [Purpureocillium lavendulum]|uniref:Pol n=1 Tax=Purpureocillium lavendulum TaxID=1247861 RepID=A0AB34FDT4_9HYPO|nr:Pol [Purpureocillium lavendulum]